MTIANIILLLSLHAATSSPIFAPPNEAFAVDIRLDVIMPKASSTFVWCKSFLLEATEGIDPNNIMAVQPMPGNLSVHHMHLHVCQPESSAWRRHLRLYYDRQAEIPLSCFPPSWQPGSGCHGTTWTYLPGQNAMTFPEGVGMKIGKGQWDLQHVILEVHYNQAHDAVGVKDQAGIRFWASKENVVKHRVGLLSVADPFSRYPHPLPAGVKSVGLSLFCPPACTMKFADDMHVFSSMTHAHLRARYVQTALGYASTSEAEVQNWTNVVESGVFAHHHHQFTPANFTIKRGSSLRTTCMYDTSGDTEPIGFGPATDSNEMCMQVFLYWPKQKTFLCGYFSDKKDWCGGADDFLPTIADEFLPEHI